MGIGFAALTLTTGACTVDSDNPMFIIHNQAPDDSCNTVPDKSRAFIPRGVLDTAPSGLRNYTFTPVVESRAEVVSSDDPLQRAIFVEGAEINLIIPEDAADLGALGAGGFLNFTERFSGTLEPNAISTFSFRIVPTQVTEAIGAGLAPLETVQILAEIEIFGELGNGGVSSPLFTYPIDVCANCTAGGNPPPCLGYQAPASACYAGQDFHPSPCCTSSAGDLVCPGVPEDPPPA